MDRREVLKSIGGLLFTDFALKADFSCTYDKFCFEVAILKADVPNGNKRIYTRKTLEAIVRKGIPELGTLGMQGGSVVRLTDVSHRVSNPRIDSEGYLLVDINVLDTPNGRILKNLLTSDRNAVNFRTSAISSNVTYKDDIAIIDDDDFVINNIAAVLAKDATEIY